MSYPQNPGEPTPPGEPLGISPAAERARMQLHEEIERVRRGVEEMLSGQGRPVDAELQRELDGIREETRLYVKKRVRKSERRLARSIREVNERTAVLEQRIDQVEADRRTAEYRLHTETERMLDGLLQEIRTIADLLSRES